jgi:hypothetical protein
MSAHPFDFCTYPLSLNAGNIFIAPPCVKGARLINSIEKASVLDGAREEKGMHFSFIMHD